MEEEEVYQKGEKILDFFLIREIERERAATLEIKKGLKVQKQNLSANMPVLIPIKHVILISPHTLVLPPCTCISICLIAICLLAHP